MTVLLQYAWTFQFVFGRYRSTGDLTVEHFVAIAIVSFVMIFVYISLLRKTMQSYEDRQAAIPRDHLPLQEHEMGKPLMKRMIAESERVDGINDPSKCTLMAADPGDGDRGWDVNGKVNYNKMIAKSFYVLEEAAISRRPNLRHRNARTIRDYMSDLRKEFPRLPVESCEAFVATYEKARFSAHKYQQTEYHEFMIVVSELFSVITERQSARK